MILSFVLFISFATKGLSDESTRRGRPEYVPGEVLVKFRTGVVKRTEKSVTSKYTGYKGERT